MDQWSDAAREWRTHLGSHVSTSRLTRETTFINQDTKQVIVITGTSSGIGALAARALAHAGHTVYASMRETAGRNASRVAEVKSYAARHGPYFAAKAAMDSLAVSYAGELTRWGIETSIIVPGAFTKGTNHFTHAGAPSDKTRAAEYHAGPYAGVPEQALKGLATLEPADADVQSVAEAIVQVVGAPFGKRPFRVHIDPSQDGCEIVNGVAGRVRAEMLRRIGLEDLLSPRVIG